MVVCVNVGTSVWFRVMAMVVVCVVEKLLFLQLSQQSKRSVVDLVQWNFDLVLVQSMIVDTNKETLKQPVIYYSDL